MCEPAIERLSKCLNMGKGIIKVSDWANHQLDVELLTTIGQYLADRVKQRGLCPTRILTSEVSGIAPALFVSANLHNIPVVYARKTKPITMGDVVYSVDSKSHTKGGEVTLSIDAQFMEPGDQVLIVDDVLASGRTAADLADLVSQAGATLLGFCNMMEKQFEGGRRALDNFDVPVYSACIAGDVHGSETVPLSVSQHLAFEATTLANNVAHDQIAVVDFGGQYTHLIATKLRAACVRCIIVQPNTPLPKCRGIILSGSPAGSDTIEQWKHVEIVESEVPVLGICFGHYALCTVYGAQTASSGKEYGPALLSLTAEGRQSNLLAGFPSTPSQVFLSHAETVAVLPEDWEELAYSEAAGGGGNAHHNCVVGCPAKKRFGVQFHPEVDDSVYGDTLLRNFALGICDCVPSWSTDNLLADHIQQLRQQCEGKDVFLLISGGVDSTVCAWLLHSALGADRIHLLHIDNGMMRLDESKQILEALQEHDVSKHVHFVDATEEFLSAIGQEIAPEKKRKIIGETFISVFERKARELNLSDCLLAQGTIYPDTIESGGINKSGKAHGAAVIKTHHNRVGVVEEMIAAGKVVEPIADLYKAEVRQLGTKLGVPSKFIQRHPFPGPGLGVRLLCADGNLPQLFADSSTRMIAESNSISAQFGFAATVLPTQSVGCKGDDRCYELPAVLVPQCGSVEDFNFMDACNCATAIVKSVSGINRCVVMLDATVPEKIKPLDARMTVDRLQLLQKADEVVMNQLVESDLYNTIWQCPTVLVPVELNEKQELVVVRPVHSARAMTALPAQLPAAALRPIREQLASLGVAGVAVDVTAKPPGTIEWE